MWNVIGSFIIARFVIRLFLFCIPLGVLYGLRREWGTIPVILLTVVIIGLAGWIKSQRKK